MTSAEDTHTYVLFHTVFNYHLFPTVPANVVRRTLSAQRTAPTTWRTSSSFTRALS